MDRNRTIGWGDHTSIRRHGDVERELAFANGSASFHCIPLLYYCPEALMKDATSFSLQLKEIQASSCNAIDYRLEQRIDKWRYGRALGEYNQSAQQKHDDDNGGHPEFLPHLHEIPEIFQKIQH